MTVRRIPLFYAIIPVVLLLASAQLSSAQEIVLYASQAPVKAGNWSSVADSTAAGGARLHNPDAGAAKIQKAASSPSSYAELTFSALAGIPYRIWVRGKAQGNSPYNDSIFVQFSGSLDISGSAAYRIGTTSATEINLEDCLGCGVSGWGWQDNGWGVAILGPAIFFQSTGTQTLRIQTREDGFSIDQIVLSPSTYLYNPPGALKNDGVILPASSGPVSTPTPTPTPTAAPSSTDIVIWASNLSSTSLHGAWAKESNSTAAGQTVLRIPDRGGNKVSNAFANPTDYFEVTFSGEAGKPYRLWLRGRADNDHWANDSVFAQFSGTVDSSGSAVYRIGTTNAVSVNLEECSNCGIQGWGWQDNGWGGVGLLGPAVYFQNTGTQTLRIQNREDGFAIDQIVLSSYAYLHSSPGSNKNDTTILQSILSQPILSAESPNNTRVPPGTQIVDSNLDYWTLSNGTILRNGGGTGGAGSQILYCNRIVYVFGTDSQWWRWTGSGWTPVGTTDPCGGSTPTASTESPNNTRVPPGTQIVDSNSGVWTLSNGAILRNGAGTGGAGSQILYCNRIVYVFGTDSQWWRWTGSGWIPVGTTDPCATPSTNQPPQVSISATPTSGTSPLFVSFSSVASDPDGNISSYQWDFGNGSTSGMPYPTTTYQSAGTYTARLTVYDNAGATASAAIQINVSAPISTAATLRVLSWNIAFGKGTDNIQNWDRQAAWIAQMNPDLVGLCEMPSEWVSTLVSLLNQKTGRTWYSHFLPKYNGTTEGNLILSKYNFSSTGGRFLSAYRSVAQATVSVSGKTINFFATHLDPDSSSTRYAQVGEIMNYAAGFSESHIVVGDFNAGPDLSESVRMTSSYYDGWIRAMNAGTAVAYPDNPVGMHTRTRRGRIDYVYYSHSSPNLFLKGKQIPDTRDLNNKNVVITLGTLDDKGVRPSDHNPTIATFDLK